MPLPVAQDLLQLLHEMEGVPEPTIIQLSHDNHTFK
jgi:hypothetical protein